MKRLILIGLLALGLTAFPAMAGIDTSDLDFSGLDEAKKAEIVQLTEKLKTETKEAKNAEPVISVEKVSEYTIMGKEIASAFIALAGELGKTVDELLGTTIGKVALGLVVYKIVLEGSILGFIGGAIWLMIFVPGWIYYFRRFCVVDSVDKEYHENGKLKSKRVIRRDPSENAVAYFTIVLVIGILIEIFLVFA